VVEDVELARGAADDHLVEGLVVVDGIAGQPVGAHRSPRQVQVEPSRVVGDGAAGTDVVRLGRIEVLDAWSKNHHSQIRLPAASTSTMASTSAPS